MVRPRKSVAEGADANERGLDNECNAANRKGKSPRKQRRADRAGETATRPRDHAPVHHTPEPTASEKTDRPSLSLRGFPGDFLEVRDFTKRAASSTSSAAGVRQSYKSAEAINLSQELAGRDYVEEGDSEVDVGCEDSSDRRSSGRLKEKQTRSFRMPSRDEILGKIPNLSSYERSYTHLLPRKLVNDYTRETHRYNYDPNYTSGEESIEDFIVDDEVAHKERHKSHNTSESEKSSEKKSKAWRKKKATSLTDSSSSDDNECRVNRNRKRSATKRKVSTSTPKAKAQKSDSDESVKGPGVKHRRSFIESSSESEKSGSDSDVVNTSEHKRNKRHSIIESDENSNQPTCCSNTNSNPSQTGGYTHEGAAGDISSKSTEFSDRQQLRGSGQPQSDKDSDSKSADGKSLSQKLVNDARDDSDSSGSEFNANLSKVQRGPLSSDSDSDGSEETYNKDRRSSERAQYMKEKKNRWKASILEALKAKRKK